MGIPSNGMLTINSKDVPGMVRDGTELTAVILDALDGHEYTQNNSHVQQDYSSWMRNLLKLTFS